MSVSKIKCFANICFELIYPILLVWVSNNCTNQSPFTTDCPYKVKKFSIYCHLYSNANFSITYSKPSLAVAYNHLPFLKIFSNFVNFYPNFQVFCSFLFLFFLPFFSVKVFLHVWRLIEKKYGTKYLRTKILSK